MPSIVSKVVCATMLAVFLPQTVLSQESTTAPAPQTKPSGAGVIELRRQINESYSSKDYPAFLESVSALQEIRPYNSDYLVLLVLAHALNGDKGGAYEVMLKMQQQGLAHDFNETEDSESIRGTEAYDYINDLMIRAREPAGSAEIQFTLPESLLLPTDLAWDPTRERFLVGNARDGAIFSIDRAGKTEELLRADENNGLWAIYGLLVDSENNRLWVSSAASANFIGNKDTDAGRSAVFEFTLDTLEFQKKYPVTVDGRPHRLGRLVKDKAGNLYAIDSVLPVIYRLSKGEDRLKPFVASRDMVSLRDIAVTDDGNVLYVADYEMGILALDLQNKRAIKLTGPETLNFGGIDGLSFWQGHLVMVQSGISPQRVMRLELSEDGGSVVEVAPLAIAHPSFKVPNHGVIVDEDLVFMVNSHEVRGQQSLQPIQIARTKVSNAPNLGSPDVDKFWDEYYEKQGLERPDKPASEGADTP